MFICLILFMNFLKTFPSEAELLKSGPSPVFDLNGHIHTPFSFSAFQDIDQIFSMATREGIRAVGINDFIVTDGHRPFHDAAVKAGIFPLFNIEFMGLLRDQQKMGIKVNDPSNPGRTYFSGKGLDFPSNPDPETANILQRVKEESNKQTAEMIARLDKFLRTIDVPFGLSYPEVKEKFARELVRERHIAQALRQKVVDVCQSSDDQRALLTQIFSGKPVESPMENINLLENEIRNKLLKSGGPAYVEEDENAFLAIENVMDIIIKMGGIPCYPVLLDDKTGNCTAFESDFEGLRDALKGMGVGCVELIPGRNDINILRKFVRIFHADDFVITFGTEHNTPELIPLKVDTRGHIDLDDELKEISFRGACVIAAHQYNRARVEQSYIGVDGQCRKDQIKEFRTLGAAVFNHFFSR